MLFINVLVFIISLAALIFASGKVVNSVVRLATALSIPPFLIALTIVAIGTSLPELTTAIISSLANLPAIPLGNIIGANIANIGLSIGLAYFLFPFNIRKKAFRSDITILIMITTGFFIMAFDNIISRTEGMLMLFLFVWYMVHLAKSQHAILKKAPLKVNAPSAIHPLLDIMLLLVCLALLIGSSKFLLGALIGIATDLNIPKEIVAMTILSIGTTVPELSIMLASTRSKNADIGIGTIIGSNSINILLILGLAATIAPLPVSSFALTKALPVLLALTAFLYHYVHESWFGRIVESLMLLLIYILFLILIILSL